MDYKLIRIDRDVVIKVPRRTGGTGEGSIYLYFGEVETDSEQPLVLGGEIAAGLREWISGRRTFQVSSNGVLDIYGGIVENRTAERTLTGDPINFPLVDIGTMMNDAQDGPYVGNIKPNAPQGLRNDAVPRIDVDKIAAKIRQRDKSSL